MMRSLRPIAGDVDDEPADTDFAAFYRRAYPSARRLAHLLTNGSGDADDIVQDAFARIHDRYRELRAPDAYLRRAVVNGCNQRFRGRSRESTRLRLVAGGQAAESRPTDSMLDAVAGLPARQRAAIVLRYWADLDDDEIADALNARRSTVRSLVHRGLITLRKDIGS